MLKFHPNGEGDSRPPSGPAALFDSRRAIIDCVAHDGGDQAGGGNDLADQTAIGAVRPRFRVTRGRPVPEADRAAVRCDGAPRVGGHRGCEDLLLAVGQPGGGDAQGGAGRGSQQRRVFEQRDDRLHPSRGPYAPRAPRPGAVPRAIRPRARPRLALPKRHVWNEYSIQVTPDESPELS